MTRYKKTNFLKSFVNDVFPNGRDNIFQILIKVLFLLGVIGIVASSIYFTTYYYRSYHEHGIIETDREYFYRNGEKEFKKQNSDYEAWLSIKGTELDNPVFKSNDNSFYLTHNSLKEKSSYGSLFLDYRFNFSDKNVVVYGNSKDGMLFSTLSKLRQLDFYKKNPVVTVINNGIENDYLIYAIFVMNSSKSQDNGNIYSIYQKDFYNEATFDNWVLDAKKRSLINTNVDVEYDDKILTLVTDCGDFEGARLVVMARTLEIGEIFSLEKTSINPKPQYPKKWYDDRNIKYPF